MKRILDQGRTGLVSFLILIVLQVAPVFGATVVVQMTSANRFSPSTQTINLGDTVLWTNTTTTAHNVVSGTPGNPDGLFGTPGVTYTSPGTYSFTFTSTGSFPYFCEPHQFVGMTGTIMVQAANSSPVVTGAGSTLTYVESSGQQSVDSTISVSDPDSANLVSATVSFASGFVITEDLLNFVNTSGVSMTSYDGSTGTLVLGGTTSPENYQIALRQVKYANTSRNPNTATRVIRFVVNDGQANSVPFNRSVIIQAVNDAPVVAGSGAAANYTENANPTTLDASIAVSDVDNTTLAGATVAIVTNFVASQDTLFFTDQNGITGSYNSGTGVLTLTNPATLANYQLALRSVRYQNTSHNPNTATRTVRFLASDGLATSTAFNKSVTITAVNDAPSVVGVGGTLAYTEGDGAVALDTSIIVNDIDSTLLQSATVTIKTNFVGGEDSLAFTDQAGITGVFDAGTGVLGLSGAASPASYQTALQSVRYLNTSRNPSTVTRAVEFKANDGQSSSSVYFRSVSVTATNDPPSLTGSGGALTYTEKDGLVPVDASLVVSDPDNANLSSATVSISANFTSAEDSLVFTNQNGISGIYIANTGDLVLTGASSMANYQTALRSVRYLNSSFNPSTATRTITFTASDGALTSAAYTRNITVASVNDAPVVTFASPANNFIADAPVTISISVTATDVDGSVTQVEVFEGSNSLGVQAGGSYGMTLNNVNAGPYVFTARATDNLGMIGSATVTNYVRAVVSNPVRLGGGEFQFNLSGLSTTKTNVIEYSTNLRTWTVQTNFLPQSGAMIFTDGSAVGQPNRAYRHSVK